MSTQTFDARGLRCPQPVLKIALLARSIPAGTLLIIQADCRDFPRDIKLWCQKSGKTLLVLNETKPGEFVARVQF